MMTYTEFQNYCARFGFVGTPITREEYAYLVGNGFDIEDIYGVACDVACGFEFSDAMQATKESE